MKKNIYVQDQLDGTESLRTEQHGRKSSMPLISLRFSIVILVLVACIGFYMGSPAPHTYAKSACGVLFSCPTPTPNPTPRPAPNPTPTPIPAPPPPMASPTPSLQPSPTTSSAPVLAPTVTASASPTAAKTATPTRVAQKTPVPDPTSIPVTHNQKTGSHTADQSGGNGFSQMLTIIAIVFVCLLIVLAIGLLIFRRMLLPSINMKLPASGVSSWTRTLPPDSFPGLVSMDGTHEMQPAEPPVPALATTNNDAGTRANSFAPSSQGFMPDTAGVASASAETVANLPVDHSASPWYDISDEPFNT